jgi:hypothetical protein
MAAQQGYLVLADISGYTSYLAGVELDHAHEVLADLLETLVGRLRPLLTIAKLEGDAVFGYVPESGVVRGETVFELVETTYAAFRDRVEAIRRRTTCECNACRAIPNLDLKFIVHRGSYMVQNVAGISELVGSDVNLAHRLLKNHVAEATQWRAYALFTWASLEQLGLPCDRTLLHAQGETYEHLGTVETYSLNLRERYAALLEGRRVRVTPEEADASVEQELPAPPVVVWDWLNDPAKREAAFEGTRWTVEHRPNGRTAAGARNHCAHGKHEVSVETVMDWRPFEYFTTDHAVPMPPLVFRSTFELRPAGETGTHVTVLVRVLGKAPRLVTRPVGRTMIAPDYRKGLKKLDELLRAA